MPEDFFFRGLEAFRRLRGGVPLRRFLIEPPPFLTRFLARRSPHPFVIRLPVYFFGGVGGVGGLGGVGAGGFAGGAGLGSGSRFRTGESLVG